MHTRAPYTSAIELIIFMAEWYISVEYTSFFSQTFYYFGNYRAFISLLVFCYYK